jgi:hypothetical protein
MSEKDQYRRNSGIKENKHESSDASTVQRRTVLSVIAATGSLGIPGTVRAGPSAYVKATAASRPFDNPLSLTEIKQIQSEKLGEFADKAGIRSRNRFHSVLDEASGQLVGYAAGVTPDGVLRQSFGIAERPEDVGRAQRGVTTESEKFNNQMSSRRTTDEQVTTEDTNWRKLEDSKMTTYSEEGNLIDYYKWLQSTDDYDYYAYRDRFVMEPGTLKNGYGEMYMDWSDSNPEMSLQDWEPFNGTDGSVSSTFELSSNGFSYSYEYTTGETSVEDDVSDRVGEVDWRIDFNSSSSRQTSSGFEPSTMGKIASGSPDQSIYSVESIGTFASDNNYQISNSRSFLPY